MKKALIGAAVVLMAAQAMAGERGMVTRASRHDVSTTIDRLEKVVRSKGMTVFARIDHGAQAEEAGLAMPPSQLLIFGNPKGGTPLMLAAPTVAIDLPLKALAWQDRDGKVWLTYNSAKYLDDRHRIPDKEEALRALESALDAMAGEAVE